MTKKYIFTKGEKYIAVDTDSGYPYETNQYMSVKTWPNIEAATEYYNHFKCEHKWQLRELHGLSMSLSLGE